MAGVSGHLIDSVVMKKATARPRRSFPGISIPRRLGVAEVKAHLSEVLRRLGESPVVIHSRGRDIGVLVDFEAWVRIGAPDHPPAGGAAFLETVDALKARFGGGVEGFAPPAADLQAQRPFASSRR